MKERTVETKEVPTQILEKLLESHEKMKQKEEEEAELNAKAAEKNLKSLETASNFVNSGGSMLLMLGMSAIFAAPSLMDVAWMWGDLASVMLSIAGQLGVVAGLGMTGRAAFNNWAQKERGHQLVKLTQAKQPLLLTE